MDSCVASVAEAQKVGVLVAPAFSQRHDVMNLCCLYKPSVLLAYLTEGIGNDMLFPYLSPFIVEISPIDAWVSSLLVVPLEHQLGMLGAVSSVCEVLASWIFARLLWLVWHRHLKKRTTLGEVLPKVAQAFFAWRFVHGIEPKQKRPI